MMSQLTRTILLCASTASIVVYQQPAFALNWLIRPNINVKQIYSDNITLSDTNRASALVTEVNPGVLINGSSSRSSFDLNYNLQGLYNARGSSSVELNNQLQMNSNYELVKKRLFVDSSSSISQQNNSNRQIAGDNISGSGNSSTISTFKLSPYWAPHFKGFADGEVRLTYDKVSSSGQNSLSNTNSLSQNISLNSGHDFSLFSWSFLFNNSDRNNSGSENVSFQNSQLEVRYAIGRKYSIFARAGYSNNSFATNSNSSNNGISYTFGGQWEPSQRLRVEAGYGNNKFITVEISPFNRLHWISTYSNNDIGLNTGNTWNTELNYNTRRTEWTIRYSEDTTTTQQILLDQQVVSTSNNTSPLFSRNTALPTLTNEVFVSKTADISFSFQTGKSNISANAYRTLRTFELSGNDEKVTGLSTSWNWKFIKRTSSNLQIGWQKTQSDGLNSFSDKRFNFSASVTRNILSRLNGSIEYRFVDQSSSDSFNKYSENRITATLTLQY